MFLLCFKNVSSIYWLSNLNNILENTLKNKSYGSDVFELLSGAWAITKFLILDSSSLFRNNLLTIYFEKFWLNLFFIIV